MFVIHRTLGIVIMSSMALLCFSLGSFWFYTQAKNKQRDQVLLTFGAVLIVMGFCIAVITLVGLRLSM